MKMDCSLPRLIYAANRGIGLTCLQELLTAGWKPMALLIPDDSVAQCTEDMHHLLRGVPVLVGRAFRSDEGVELLTGLKPNYVLSVHFPYIIPSSVLAIPTLGVLNLHPALLPYNKGWHTPTWAIHDQTPYGATLHWVDEGTDTGPIAMQRKVEVHPYDTADSLYQRVIQAEIELFREAIPSMIERKLPMVEQVMEGTKHSKRDIKDIQKLKLDSSDTIRNTLSRLRALTTNNWGEAAFFEHNGIRYRVRIEIKPDE